MSQTLALPRAFELPGGGRLPRLGAVDAVALEARAAELAKRSIKRESKVFALELAIRMMDLDDARGRRHARQGARVERQGDATCAR